MGMKDTSVDTTVGVRRRGMTGADQDKPSFGDKLAYLIKTVHPSDRGPYSYREIAAGITGHSGAMTAAHINQLVKGKQPYPRIHHIEALASFFGVPVNYFFDDEVTDRVSAQLAALEAERQRRALNADHEDVRLMAMRAGELSEERRKQVMDLLDVIYKLEQAERATNG
jgi:transcriptional regulator with XRE-family HTH domain